MSIGNVGRPGPADLPARSIATSAPAPPPFVARDRLLLVSINKQIQYKSIYDAARYAWPVNRERAENIDLVLACAGGIVQGVFVPSRWMDASPGEATRRNFPGFVAGHKGPKLGFEGREADEASKKNYLGKRVPDNLRVGQNGFRYSDDWKS